MGGAVDKLLEILAKWWPDFWPLMLAPPIYVIWLKFLSGPKWTARIRGWLDNEVWSGAYAAMLNGLSGRLGTIFGEKWFGARAFGMCFSIAVFYALLWLFLQIALNEMQAATSREDKRDIMIGIGLALPVGLVTYWLTRMTKRRYAARRAQNPERSNALLFREFLIYFMIGGVAVAVAGAGAGAVAGLMFLFIPFVNAAFDWPSWAASRWLVSRLGRDATEPALWRRWGLLAGHVLLDIGLALAALLGLAVVLAMIFGGGARWTAVYDDPFSLAGSTLSVMLLSTLVPTAVHLFCAVFAVFPALPFGHRRVVAFMPFKRNYDEFEAGDRMVVAAWLTLWSVVSMAVVWGLFEGAVWSLDWIATARDWNGDGQTHTFWQVLLDTARGIQQWTGIEFTW